MKEHAIKCCARYCDRRLKRRAISKARSTTEVLELLSVHAQHILDCEKPRVHGDRLALFGELAKCGGMALQRARLRPRYALRATVSRLDRRDDETFAICGDLKFGFSVSDRSTRSTQPFQRCIVSDAPTPHSKAIETRLLLRA